MEVTGKKLSELTDKVENIKGTERIYVSDGTGVPKYIETSLLAKSTDIPETSGFATKKELEGKANKITVEDGGSGTVVKELEPNILYKFGECANLTITLAATTSNADEFMFVFDSGATATILSIPETVISDSDFVINANAHYEVSIRDNYLVYKEWIKS